MKKTNFASMLAVTGGLALATAACSAPAEEADTAADETSVEETACAAEGCEAACEGAECEAACEGAECEAACEGAECEAAE